MSAAWSKMAVLWLRDKQLIERMSTINFAALQVFYCPAIHGVNRKSHVAYYGAEGP